MTNASSVKTTGGRRTWAAALLAAAVVACAGCTQGPDDPTSQTTAGPAPTVGQTPGPLPDLCDLVDVTLLAGLVPDTAGAYESEELAQEANGRCTFDNGLSGTQNRRLVVRATTWPEFDDETLRTSLEERCAGATTEPEHRGDALATCAGTGAPGEISAYGLTDRTEVAVELSTSPVDGASDQQQSAVLRILDDVLAGL